MTKYLCYYGAVLCGLALAGCVSTQTGNTAVVNNAEAARINTQLGAEYMRQGNRDRAMQKLQLALSQDADLPATHTTIALLYEQMGDLDRAEQHYRRALRLAPGDPDTQNNYGAFLCRQNRYKQAVKYFLKAATNSQYSTPEAAYTNAGICAKRIPDLSEAEKNFRKAIGINPQFAQALWELAQLSFDQRKYLDARAFLQRFTALVRQPNAEVLWLGYRTEKKLGAHDAARHYAEKLRRDFPDSPQTHKLGRDGK